MLDTILRLSAGESPRSKKSSAAMVTSTTLTCMPQRAPNPARRACSAPNPPLPNPSAPVPPACSSPLPSPSAQLELPMPTSARSCPHQKSHISKCQQERETT